MKKKVASLLLVMVIMISGIIVVSPTLAATWPTLQQNSTAKNEVTALQYLLNHYGYGPTLTIDGSFGPNTLSAVKNFQKGKGLSVDGAVGPKTWTALTNLNQSTSSYKANPTKAIQYLLRYKYGVSDLAVDGSFGPATKTAVLAFQKAKGLAQDGIVEPNTWNGLIASSSFTLKPPPTTTDPKRQKVADYMRKMATVKFQTTKSITFYGKTYTAGKTYLGIPYSQDSRNANYDTFVALGSFSGDILKVGSLKGSDCSSAVSYALGSQGLLSGVYTTATLPNASRVKSLGSGNFAALRPGDFINKSGHVRLVVKNDTANKKVTCIEQSSPQAYTYNGYTTSWKIDSVYTYSDLSGVYTPYTLTGYTD